MKTTANYRSNAKVIPYRAQKAIHYPNAATKQDLLNRTLDYLLTAATSAGIVTALICLFTLF